MAQLLLNQVAVVTGGNSGIGKAIVTTFLEQGAKVAVIGTNVEKGLAVIEDLKLVHPNSLVKFYRLDVSNTQETDTCFKQIYEDFGSIDILINNAGVTADQLLMKMTEEEWDRVIDINLKSCFNTCRSIVRQMMKARKGRIVNISSVVGITGNAGQVNYAASKAGMIGLTKALAKELASRGILVNCIAPGFIETPMTDVLNERQKESILQSIPLGHLGTPADIANAALFLTSHFSNYVTGQVLAVDGGMVM